MARISKPSCQVQADLSKVLFAGVRGLVIIISYWEGGMGQTGNRASGVGHGANRVWGIGQTGHRPNRPNRASAKQAKQGIGQIGQTGHRPNRASGIGYWLLVISY